MLFIALLGNFLLLFIDSNGKNESVYDPEKYSISITVQEQYRGDRKSNNLTGVDFYFKQPFSYFRPKIAFYSTENGTHFISIGISKDVKIIDRLYISTHLLPSYSSIKGDNKLNNSGTLNFNVGIGFSFLITNSFAVSLQAQHVSNAKTHMPNRAIEAIGLSVRFKI